MPDETPIFASTPLPEPKPTKKRAQPARRVLPAKTKKTSPPKTRASEASRLEINQTLTSLYKNNNQDGDVKTIKIKKPSFLGRFISRLLIVGIVVGLVMWVGARLNPSNKTTGKESSLKVEVQGPSEVALGAPSTFTIVYSNTDSAALTNVTLNVNYPSGFVLASSSLPATNDKQNEWSLGTLAPHSQNSLTLTGAEYAPLGQNQSWRIFVKFRPANFNSDLQTAATLPLVVNSSPLSLTVSGPDTASVGKDVMYTFTVTNQGLTTFPGLTLMPQWGNNFSVTSFTPPLVKNRWVLADNTATSTKNVSSTPSAKMVFKLVGKFTDAASATSSLAGHLTISPKGASTPLTASDATLVTNLTKNNIEFNLAINGAVGDFSIAPGDTLNTTIRLKNSSDHDLKNAVMTLSFDAPANDKKQSVLGWSDLNEPYNADVFGKQLDGNMRRGTITWDSKILPGLAKIKPGEEITIDVRLPIKTGTNFDLSSLTEKTIVAVGNVTYDGASKASESLITNSPTITLNSDLTLSVQNKTSVNAAGKKQFDEGWILSNSFHALKNITVSANVFGDAAFSYVSSSLGAGTVTYTASEQKLTWQIPDMPVSVDTLAFPFTIVLNKDNPTQNTLIGKAHVTAQDTITGQTIDFLTDEITLPTQ